MPIRDGLDLLPGSEDLYTLDLQALLYGSDYGARYRMRILSMPCKLMARWTI